MSSSFKEGVTPECGSQKYWFTFAFRSPPLYVQLEARSLLIRALEDGDFGSLVDQRLQRDYNDNKMARMVVCAVACVRHSARHQPHMSQVISLPFST